MLTLDRLEPGQRGCIESILGTDSLSQRLMEMGMLEGEHVEVVGIAPFGDPLELLVRDYRLSLRRAEAARIQVSIVP